PMTAMFRLELSAIICWDQIHAGCVLFSNVHAPDQAFAYEIGVMNHAIQEHSPSQVANNLMNLSYDAAVIAGFEINWFHVRINHSPLARPVSAHSFASVYPTAFHPVRPLD